MLLSHWKKGREKGREKSSEEEKEGDEEVRKVGEKKLKIDENSR